MEIKQFDADIAKAARERGYFIMPKVDWLTVVFNDMTIMQVFEVFGIDSVFYADYEEVFSRRFDLSKGWCTKVCFMWQGVNIQVNRSELLE